MSSETVLILGVVGAGYALAGLYVWALCRAARRGEKRNRETN